MDESRQIGEERERLRVAVASAVGVVVVRIGGDRVGEFALEHRCEARDVAAADGRLAVATPEDVLLGDDAAPADFGPATVVGADGATVVAVGPDGAVGRHDDEWTDCGRIERAVRAADGDLLAAADGVYRTDGTHLGLDDARDVVADGWAATGAGLYRRTDDDWERAREGDFVAVTAAEDRVVAATADEVAERRDGSWTVTDAPVAESVVDVGLGRGTVAVTERGTVLVDAGDGWRSRSLGVPDVTRMAALGPERKRI